MSTQEITLLSQDVKLLPGKQKVRKHFELPKKLNHFGWIYQKGEVILGHPKYTAMELEKKERLRPTA